MRKSERLGLLHEATLSLALHLPAAEPRGDKPTGREAVSVVAKLRLSSRTAAASSHSAAYYVHNLQRLPNIFSLHFLSIIESNSKHCLWRPIYKMLSIGSGPL